MTAVQFWWDNTWQVLRMVPGTQASANTRAVPMWDRCAPEPYALLPCSAMWRTCMVSGETCFFLPFWLKNAFDFLCFVVVVFAFIYLFLFINQIHPRFPGDSGHCFQEVCLWMHTPITGYFPSAKFGLIKTLCLHSPYPYSIKDLSHLNTYSKVEENWIKSGLGKLQLTQKFRTREMYGCWATNWALRQIRGRLHQGQKAGCQRRKSMLISQGEQKHFLVLTSGRDFSPKSSSRGHNLINYFATLRGPRAMGLPWKPLLWVLILTRPQAPLHS